MKNRIKVKGSLKTFFLIAIYMGILMVFVSVAIWMLNRDAGLIMAIFTALYLLIMGLLTFRNKPIIMNELISFATEYGQIQKRLLRDLELPYVLLDDTGKILWMNKEFEGLVHKQKGYNKSITSIFSDMVRDKLPNEENEETSFAFSYEERDFTAKCKMVPLKDIAADSETIVAESYSSYLIAMYLFDETALKLALRENDDQSLAVALLYMDNYDEALESVEEVRRSLLTALIDRKINKYIASLDGIAKKIEKDKFLVILRKKSVRQLQENKFEILEDVKTVNIGNDMAVTISIGLGLDGLTYSQNYEFARTAIDLALGRGGDQAVVKQADQITYYGGKSQQIEKNTRVKARVKAHALREIIASKDRVIIMGHRYGDVDSFGASVGIYRIARTLDRKAHIVLNDVTTSVQPMRDMFMSQPDYEEDMIISSDQAMDLAGGGSVLVVVDVNKPSITECPDLLKMCKSIVVLDHHRQGTETIENATLSYVEAYASSACEMVTEILQYISDGIKIKSDEADCLYSGMMIDTNNFMTKTGVRTFEAAAYLRRAGADVTRVRKLFRDDVDEYKAKADAVRQAEVYRGVYAMSKCTAGGEVQSPTIVGAQAANELLNIKGIKASFVFTDYQEMIHISARSIDEVNVQVIMERLGGGGHMNVAACQLEGISIDDAMGKLKALLDKMIEEGEL
ncbi:MAG: DHH family phosphoesterase [Lachnospiraceae bacterium]|nr:DHH family phosphoesterase [Candidatus Colinaster scatohippi]